nr:hypothetical protein [Chroomonas debatzensis]
MCNSKKLAKSQNRLMWDTINWIKVKRRISRVQRRIFKARLAGKMGVVHNLQVRLIQSLDGKALAVRQITKMNTKNYLVSQKNLNELSLQEKISLVYRLRIREETICTSIKPHRSVKENSNFFTFSIKNLVKKNLIRLALEPEYEAIWESQSHISKPERSAYGALDSLYIRLRKAPAYVIILDFSHCFNKINAAKFLKVLHPIALINRHLKTWFESNTMSEQLEYLKQFSSYGGPCNPESQETFKVVIILVNMILHNFSCSFKNYVQSWGSLDKKLVNYDNFQIIQYLTQVIIICPNKPLAKKIKEEISQLVSLQGLDSSLITLRLFNSNEGFNFLGFQIITLSKNEKYRVKIHIANQSKINLLKQTRIIIQKNKAVSAYTLIRQLNSLLIPWAKYFSCFEGPKDFSQIDYKLYSQIRAWVFRRKAQGKNRSFLKEKYFPKNKEYLYEGTKHKDNWVLVGQHKLKTGQTVENYLPRLRWIKTRKNISPKRRYSLSIGEYLYWKNELNG